MPYRRDRVSILHLLLSSHPSEDLKEREFFSVIILMLSCLVAEVKDYYILLIFLIEFSLTLESLVLLFSLILFA